MDLIRNGDHLRVARRTLLKFVDFRRVVAAQFVSQSADALMLVVLARALLFADPSGPTPVLLAQAAMTGAAPLVLAGPVAGFVADRWPRKQIMVTGQAVRAGLACCAALSVALDWRAVTFLGFVLALCATRVLFTARVASVRHLVRQHELVAADSLMLITGVLAASLGAVVFGATMFLGSTTQLLIVGVGHFTAAYVFDTVRSWLGGDGETGAVRWRAVITQLACGKTRFAVASTSLHRFLVGVIVAAVALDIDGRTDGSASGYALTLGVAGAAAFAGSVTSEWVNERVPRRSLTIACFAVAGCALIPPLLVSDVAVYLVAAAAVAFLFQNLRVASDATIQANAAPGSCGRVFAAYDIGFNMSYVIGLIVGLALTSNFSVVLALGTAAPLYLVGAVVFSVLERGDARVRETVESSGVVAGERILPHESPTHEGEQIEDGGDQHERRGSSTLPHEVA